MDGVLARRRVWRLASVSLSAGRWCRFGSRRCTGNRCSVESEIGQIGRTARRLFHRCCRVGFVRVDRERRKACANVDQEVCYFLRQIFKHRAPIPCQVALCLPKRVSRDADCGLGGTHSFCTQSPQVLKGILVVACILDLNAQIILVPFILLCEIRCVLEVACLTADPDGSIEVEWKLVLVAIGRCSQRLALDEAI